MICILFSLQVWKPHFKIPAAVKSPCIGHLPFETFQKVLTTWSQCVMDKIRKFQEQRKEVKWRHKIPSQLDDEKTNFKSTHCSLSRKKRTRYECTINKERIELLFKENSWKKAIFSMDEIDTSEIFCVYAWLLWLRGLIEK